MLEWTLREWHAAAREVVELLAGDAQLLSRPAEGVSAWSPLQHAAHVTLANELVLRNVRNLARGSGMLVVEGAEPNPRALEVLARGVLPRGAVQAPRMVTPPPDIDAATARDWAQQFAHDLEQLARSFDAGAVPRGLSISHQTLGPLDLSQWVRFGTVHTRHHLAIAREASAP
jgi:hypothetical protein